MVVRQLIYRSEMSQRLSTEEARQQMDAILQAAWRRNALNGLTGAMTLAGNVFVQVLEGPPAALEITFERICRDVRHKRLHVFEFTPSTRRVFGGWPMGEVESTGELVRLCNAGESLGTRISPATAAVVVRTMRSLLTAPVGP